MRTDNCEEMKKELIRGRHPLNTRSVLSHVLFPEGFSVTPGIRENSDKYYHRGGLLALIGWMEGEEK